MIVAFRNYFRNKMVNLTALSVRHFVPNAKFYCFTYFKNTEEEYKDQEPLHEFIEQKLVQTKVVTNNSLVHDSEDVTKSSGYQNSKSHLFFTEGYNDIFEMVKDVDQTVLCLCEDHFFTTGKVINELLTNSFDIAYGDTDQGDFTANACILAFNPSNVKKYFPLADKFVHGNTIEQLLRDRLIAPAMKDGLSIYRIENRKWVDYCGDGLYTNSSKVMEEEMTKAGIKCSL